MKDLFFGRSRKIKDDVSASNNSATLSRPIISRERRGEESNICARL